MGGLKPSFGIQAGLTVLENTATGAIYVATKTTEETQCKGENRNHIKTVGDLTVPVPDIGEAIMKLYEEMKHGDEEHQNWLKEKCESFIERELC